MVLIKEIIETISVLCKTYNVRIYFNDNLEMVLTKYNNELDKTGRGKTDIVYEQIYNMEDLKTNLPLETLVMIFSQEADKYFSERDSRKYLKKFEEIVVEYPPADLCTYPEYKGKPYFSIKYEENGEHFIGFGTYSPEVLSRYLQEYFIIPKNIEADKEE